MSAIGACSATSALGVSTAPTVITALDVLTARATTIAPTAASAGRAGGVRHAIKQDWRHGHRG